MDDFSWGNTRVVTGEAGRQIVVSDEGKFDPKSIPRKRWKEYQAELWDAQTQRDEMDTDARSMISGVSYATRAGAFGMGGAKTDYASNYGGYGPPGPGSCYVNWSHLHASRKLHGHFEDLHVLEGSSRHLNIAQTNDDWQNGQAWRV